MGREDIFANIRPNITPPKFLTYINYKLPVCNLR